MRTSARTATRCPEELDERDIRKTFELIDSQLRDNLGAVEVWTDPFLVRPVDREYDSTTGRIWIKKTTLWFGIHEFPIGFRLAVREVRSVSFKDSNRRLRFGYKESIAQLVAADTWVQEQAFRALPSIMVAAAMQFRSRREVDGGGE